MRADICAGCGSGILDGEHIANYPYSRRVKSIRTNPANHAAQGDERIRTAVPAPGADPVYEALCDLLDEIERRPADTYHNSSHLWRMWATGVWSRLMKRDSEEVE